MPSTASPNDQSAIQAPDLGVSELQRAREFFLRGQMTEATTHLRLHLLVHPTSAEAFELLAQIHARTGKFQDAIAHYQDAISHQGTPSLLLLHQLADAQMKIGAAYDSLNTLKVARGAYPRDFQTHFDIAGLASILGLPGDAVDSMRQVLMAGRADPEGLIVLAGADRVQPDGELCKRLLKMYPSDLRPHFALALLDIPSQRWDEIAKRLQPLVAKVPEFYPAYSLLGQALIYLDDRDSISKWFAESPEAIQTTSEYWHVLGLWYERQGELEAAARAYWEGLRRPHIDEVALLTRLAGVLSSLSLDVQAKQVNERLVLFGSLRDAMDTFFERGSHSQSDAMKVAFALKTLGHDWEAEAWGRWAISMASEPMEDAREHYATLRKMITKTTSWRDPAKDIGSSMSFASFQLPAVHQSLAKADDDSSDRRQGAYKLVDEAPQRGLIHTCQISPMSTQIRSMWIYQSLGGGISSMDFDLDGWPDLAAGNLDGEPLQVNSDTNMLFRNLDGQFRNVTEQSQWLDFGYSQGLVVNDFNDDGFPDFYDANIGKNRLFRNNGDGTFQDVTESSGLEGNQWTTSAVVADFDGDNIADIFELSYIADPRAYEVAPQSNGSIKTISPMEYSAASDRVWRGTGDGRFEDVSAEWIEQNNLGRGLGLVVGALDERPGLDVYVANDMTVNHFWSADSSENDFRFLEIGMQRGLAVNGRSLAQASMGMAAGDPDNDGDIDFFLTHFSNDYNTFYEQTRDGLWMDSSFKVGLPEPSIPLLGFGTEWVDLDNNRHPELVVLNGHINRFEDGKTLFEMPAQVFWQNSLGVWDEVRRETIGDYFEHNHIGRVLATIDANRDGRVDLVTSHLFEPVSLLINHTESAGNSIGLFLTSTASTRDATGTKVKYRVDGKDYATQVLAGHGFMCSNQSRIQIPIGNHEHVTDLLIHWPSGITEHLGDIKAGQDYLIVEGSLDAFPVSSHDANGMEPVR